MTDVMKALHWLSGSHKEEKPTDPVITLIRCCHITSKCRYNASIRLKRLGAFSFLTATMLSLGLILIPLLRLSGILLQYPDRVLDVMQIFLAVAVLVYTVINSSAHYELRSDSLNKCGDKIKEISRELRAANSSGDGQVNMTAMNKKYSAVSIESENHSRVDYWKAMLQANDMYHTSGIPRLWLNMKTLFCTWYPYTVPMALMLLEGVVLLDILKITTIITPYLVRSF